MSTKKLGRIALLAVAVPVIGIGLGLVTGQLDLPDLSPSVQLLEIHVEALTMKHPKGYAVVLQDPTEPYRMFLFVPPQTVTKLSNDPVWKTNPFAVITHADAPGYAFVVSNIYLSSDNPDADLVANVQSVLESEDMTPDPVTLKNGQHAFVFKSVNHGQVIARYVWWQKKGVRYALSNLSPAQLPTKDELVALANELQ